MIYDPEHLQRWTLPPNYFGAEWPDYFSSGVGQSRDSDALERSNFAGMLTAPARERDRRRRARNPLGCRLGRMDRNPPG
jgi:hypothetical protein